VQDVFSFTCMYVHVFQQNGVVHRDLKLENILLDDRGNAKVHISCRWFLCIRTSKMNALHILRSLFCGLC